MNKKFNLCYDNTLDKIYTDVMRKLNKNFISLVKYNSAFINKSRWYSNSYQNEYKCNNLDTPPLESKLFHCYKTLFPWKNIDEFHESLISCIVYNKDGLIALNKPFGIKIHGHDKPGTRYVNRQRYIIPSIKDCDYTIEDSLPTLQKYLNVPNLKILKSSERYTSGLVLLSSTDKVAKKVVKSFNTAKFQKKPHLIHWAVTLGYPVVPYRKEKVGIKFVEIEGKVKQPVIETDLSKRACKRKSVHPVHVESRVLSVNEACGTSLIEIAVSSVKWHFVRVYASNRMVPIIGDLMYGSRMKTLLGIPVKVQLQNFSSFDMQPLPKKMSESLNLPKGVNGHSMVPTLLHLKCMILPNFEEKGKDFVITAEPPSHFQWTLEKLNLL